MSNISKEQLDISICEVINDANNTETFREFIVSTEKEFDLTPRNLDNMNNTQLNEYLDFLDYLWGK